MMIDDLQGQMEPPDQIADPIGFHLWHEANKCPDCYGTGRWHPKSCKELEYPSPKDGKCPGCQGRGVRPELFDPEF